MRYIFIIFILVFLWSCTSCTDNKSENDSLVADSDHQAFSDPDTPDKSADNSLADTLNDADVSDTNDPDEEFIDDCDPKLIDAPFPYTDSKGNLTFCRPGCDTPTEKDPQCMSNLWKEQNEALCTLHPAHDCCGYPCVNDLVKPVTKEEEEEKYGEYAIVMHKCDLKINPWEWGNDGTHGVVKSWNMSEGKIGFKIAPVDLPIEKWPVKIKYVTYDIATQKYNFITPSRGQEQAYFKGNRIGLVADARSLDLNNSNIFLAYIGDDGKRELVFNSKVNFLAYEPALNDKWAFVNLRETKSSPYKMMYAKVGEWKWTTLGESDGWEPGIVGNTLVLVDDDVNGWVCDLSKSPQKITDCMKVNREGEKVRGIRIDKNDETKFVYNSDIIKLVHLELKAGSFIYNDLITDFTTETEKNAYSLAALEYKDDLLLFEEITGSQPGGLLCYYRIDKKKKYCMKKMDRDMSYEDGSTMFPYGFAEFEDKWLLYQKKGSTPLILRDMECYCKEEGVCPFEK